MRPVTLTQAGPGSTDPCPMDVRLDPANISLQVRVTDEPSPSPSPSPSVSPGADGYVVESTNSNIWGENPWTIPPDPSTWLWTPHPDFVDDNTGATVPKTEDWVGNYAFPPRAIRLRLTADYDSTVELIITQSGF